MKKVAIIDYDAGNIHSVFNAVKSIMVDAEIKIVSSQEDIFDATHMIMPGVGAFAAIERLRAKPYMVDYIKDHAFNKKLPFLGICVGMQILASKGYEHGEIEGLNWIEGEVKPFEGRSLKIPHMGWNNINVVKGGTSVFDFSKFDKRDFYFVHSFYFSCQNEQDIVAQASYGIDFPAIIAKENVIATQFHPEKSGDNGIEFLRDFLNLV